MKSKLVDIITCTLCKLEVTMDLHYNIPKTDTGIVISGLTCMNCQSEVTHDITRIQKPCSGFAHLKWEDLENLKEYRRKYKQMKSWNDAVPMFCEHCSNDGGYEKCRCYCHEDKTITGDDAKEFEKQDKTPLTPEQKKSLDDDLKYYYDTVDES